MKTEADNWLIDDIEDIVEDSEVGEFMVEAGVEEMKLSGVQLRENDDRYLIKPPIFLVRSIVAKNEEENTIQMGSLQVPRFLTGCQFPPVGAENAPKFSTFRAEPFYDMPKSFIRALYDADLQALDRIKKRIKNFPGEFAKEKYKPEYLAAFNGEEEELKWLI